MHVLLSVLLLLAFAIHMPAQYKQHITADGSSFQYGASVKLTAELNTNNNDRLYFRLALNAGIGTQAIANWFFPSYNFEMQFYNGGLGSIAKSRARPGRYWNIDLINAFTFTFGGSNRFSNKNSSPQNIPLYYFSDYVYPALQNPYWNSLSAGTNFITNLTDANKSSQRGGFVNIHINNFQVSYYNDGGPVLRAIGVGDGKDRYYTSGLMFSYHLNPENAVNLLEVNFANYNGFKDKAFEIANVLDLNYTLYKDTVQQYFNKSYISFTAANINKGYGITLKEHNIFKCDLQRIVHYGVYNAYHKTPYRPSFSLGLNYYYNQNFIRL